MSQFTPIDNIYTYTSSMTVDGIVYTVDKATWADKDAWVNSSWIYGDEVGISTEVLEREWNVWWHSSLNAVVPLEIGTFARFMTAFRVNNQIAGFYHAMYEHSPSGEKIVTDFRATIVDSFRGKGHYKYMYALAANGTIKRGYNMDITMMHNAHGVRKPLVQIDGVTHTGSSKLEWKDKSGNEVWRQYFKGDAAKLDTALKAKYGDIPHTESYTSPSDSRWASPLVLEYLGESSGAPSVSEGF